MGWRGVEQWRAGLSDTPGCFEDVVRARAAPATFEHCYQDQAWFTVFWYFCNAEYATENLDFLQAADAFAASGDLALGQEIYDRFVKDGAERQVNLKHDNRAYLDGLLGEAGHGHGPPDMFDSSRHEVMRLVSTDNFARFLKELSEVQTVLWGESAGADAWWNAEGRERSQ